DMHEVTSGCENPIVRHGCAVPKSRSRGVRHGAAVPYNSRGMTTSRHNDLSLKYVLNVPSGRKDDAEMPLVIIMHGRGADANDLADVAPLIDRDGIRFVFPNAPKPFEPYRGMSFGYTWFDGWPPTHDSIEDSRQLILKF